MRIECKPEEATLAVVGEVEFVVDDAPTLHEAVFKAMYEVFKR